MDHPQGLNSSAFIKGKGLSQAAVCAFCVLGSWVLFDFGNFSNAFGKPPVRIVIAPSLRAAFGTPHTLPGSLRANPSNHIFSYSPIGMQFTTRAVTLGPAGRPSSWTAAPISSRRRNHAAHPWGFTRIIWHGSENRCAGSTLIRVIGISRGIRVPLRTAPLLGNELNLKFNSP